MNTNATPGHTFGRLMICALVALAALAGCTPPGAPAAVGNGPTITGQPQSMMVDAGQSAGFIVGNTPSCGLINSQWQFNGVNLSDGGGISGSQTGTLQLSGVTAAQAGSYRLILTCADGTGYTISEAATLTVNRPSYPTGLPPFITSLGWSGCSGSACTIWWKTTGATKLTLTPSGGSPVDVTGLTQTLVTATTSTIYTLTASNEDGSFGRNVAVFTGPATSITSCGPITQPGNYWISASIGTTSSTTPCIDVHDTSDVYIRCVQGVVVTGSGPSTGGAINFTNVNNFALGVCNLAPNPAQTGLAYYSMLTNASMGAISASTLGSSTGTGLFQGMNVQSSNYVTFYFNTIYGGMATALTIRNSTGLDVIDNTISAIGSSYVGQNDVIVSGGSGNQLYDNTIDGAHGVDDGIIADSETGDLIASNWIKNCRDAAIEWTGLLRNVTIYDNTLEGSNFGLSAWYGSGGSYGLAGSLVSANRIQAMPSSCISGWMSIPTGFSFFYNGTGGGTNIWQDNAITDNTVVNSSCAGPSQFDFNGNGSGWTGGATWPWTMSNNLFSGNDFGAIAAPEGSAPQFWYSGSAYLPGVATDGGGNRCSQPTPPYPAGSPLVCH